MKPLHCCTTLLTVVCAAALIGCASSPTKSVDVTDNIRHSLENAGLKDVSVSQDRDKGVVTLSGHVAVNNDKLQAESLASSMAGGQVVANQIVVVPVGDEKDAKDVNSALDKGIGNNLDAALIQNDMKKFVDYKVQSGVVTLSGTVNSQALRAQVAQIAGGVPNVQQVVNELQVKNQKASSN